MSLVTVEGVYRNGRVELAQAPAGACDESRVLVTFLPDAEGRNAAAPETVELAADRAKKLARELRQRLEGRPHSDSAELVAEDRAR